MRATRTVATLGLWLFATLLFPAMGSPKSAMANEQPSLTYFALGDSYASGHGLGNYDKNHPYCARSPYAYPYRVKEALSRTYRIDVHLLACSGATAGPNAKEKDLKNKGQWDDDKDLSHQLQNVYDFLNERDTIANPDPVLITITIGANDLGLDDPNTLRQVLRPLTIIQPKVVASGGMVPSVPSVIFGPPQSGEDFFKWLDKKTAPIAPSLTTGIDSLLSHKNVHIVLTDYPNPFHAGSLGEDGCNDIFHSLSCTEAMHFILMKFNGLMLDQLIRVKDPSRLRVATLEPSFASHSSVCGYPSGIESTWFQNPKSPSAEDMLDACFHPNKQGARGIADTILALTPTMLPAPAVAPPASGSTQASQRTWTASVQVALCDAPPNSGRAMHCHGEAGVTVTISLASGKVLGSCTSGEPVQFPGGDMISLCSVDGLPFNADLVASQDASTIPAGYKPFQASLSLHVDNLIPGGGDQATFTFFNVRTDTGSSGTPGTPSGSLIEKFIVGCVPAEACYNATITLTTQEGEPITSFTCPPPPGPVSSWICLVPNVPRGIPVVITIDNIAPGYVVEQNPLTWDTTIEPTAGPVGERPIFRFSTTGGSTTSSANTSTASATLHMIFRGCPDGFDPATGDFHAECTIPLDAPDAAIISWGGDGQGGMSIAQLDRRDDDGAYNYTGRAGTMNVQLSGLAPVVRNGYQVFGADGGEGGTYTVKLVNGETREIDIFYYYQ